MPLSPASPPPPLSSAHATPDAPTASAAATASQPRFDFDISNSFRLKRSIYFAAPVAHFSARTAAYRQTRGGVRSFIFAAGGSVERSLMPSLQRRLYVAPLLAALRVFPLRNQGVRPRPNAS